MIPLSVGTTMQASRYHRRAMGDDQFANACMEVTWDAAKRVAYVKYLPGCELHERDGALFDERMSAWTGTQAPFGVLCDVKDLESTDGPYRARVSSFFKAHRHNGFTALINTGPVIHIVAEMFRLATGIQLKTFSSEAAARAWLRGKGVPT